MPSIKLLASVEVSVKPQLNRAVVCTALVVVFALVAVIGLLLGRLYLIVLAMPVVYFSREARFARRKTKVIPIPVCVTSEDDSLVVVMSQAKLMRDGGYADQKYTVELTDLSRICIEKKGLVEIFANRLSCEALGVGEEVLESHLRNAAVIAFRSDNASIELFKRFLRESNLEYLLN